MHSATDLSTATYFFRHSYNKFIEYQVESYFYNQCKVNVSKLYAVCFFFFVSFGPFDAAVPFVQNKFQRKKNNTQLNWNKLKSIKKKNHFFNINYEFVCKRCANKKKKYHLNMFVIFFYAVVFLYLILFHSFDFNLKFLIRKILSILQVEKCIKRFLTLFLQQLFTLSNVPIKNKVVII